MNSDYLVLVPRTIWWFLFGYASWGFDLLPCLLTFSFLFFRNPVGPETQAEGRGHERIIDLHGLHDSEAIYVLKHEVSVLRSTARAAEQPLQVYIHVGTGHHTRGSRTSARLPITVQQYLLEEEGLDYTEPQPGLLRVVIY